MPKRAGLLWACVPLAAALQAAEIATRVEPQTALPKAVDPTGAAAQFPVLPSAPPIALETSIDVANPAPAASAAPLAASPQAPTLEAGTARSRPEAAAPEDFTPGRLDLLFDRRAPQAPQAESAFVPRRTLRETVRGLAEPWRTENQLSKLARAPRAPGESFRFCVIGDAEPGRFLIWRLLFNRPGIFARLLSDAERRATDFTVQLGDMVSRGTMRNFLDFFRQLAAIGPQRPYLTVIGNHDRRNPHGESDSRVYRTLFGKTDYYFDHGGVRFVTLDSSAGKVTADQLRWLDKTLDTPLRKIVFTHIPPSAIKPWGKNGGVKEWGGFKVGDEEFTDIASRRGVERVYMGHIHGLRFKDYKGVRYVITGGGGSPLYPGGVRNNFHHYLTVEITADGLRETVHSADGTSVAVP